MYIYAGSITESTGSLKGSGKGITVFSFDGEHLQKLQEVEDVQPSILKVYGDRLYCTNEVKDFTGLNGSGGGVSAYAVNKTDGTIQKISQSISYGSRPSYVVKSDDGKHLFVTNHGSHTTVTCHYIKNNLGQFVLERQFDDSSVVMFAVQKDGSIGNLQDLQVIHGSGYWCHGGGQSTSHLHCVKTQGEYIYTCNRGKDTIEVFTYKNNRLLLIQEYQCPYGYAPRHMEILGKYAFVLYENYPAVSLFQLKQGKLYALDISITMPKTYYDVYPLPHFDKPHADKEEINTCGMADKRRAMPSDIHVFKEYVYVSNRCFSSFGTISLLKMEKEKLAYTASYTLPGKDPRGFAVSKDGNYLFVALCDTGKIYVYALDPLTKEIVKEVDHIDCPGVSSLAVV